MKKQLVIHPFLFALHPILFLFAYNMSQFSIGVIFVPIVIMTCLTLFFLYLLGIVFKDKQKVGLLVSLFLVLIFSYGHFYNINEIKDLEKQHGLR